MIDALRDAFQKNDTGKVDDIVASLIVDPAASQDLLIAASILCKEFLDFSSAQSLLEHLVSGTSRDSATENRLAVLLTQTGKFDEARERLLRLLEIDGDFGQTYFNLAQIYRATANDPLIVAIENRLKKTPLEKSDEYPCRLALGKLYDDIGEYDLAFAQIQQAKAMPTVPYPHDAQMQYFEKVKEAFSKDFVLAHSAEKSAEKRAIFLVGLPRTGSTLLEKLLAEHQGVASLGERAELSNITMEIARSRSSNENYLPVIGDLSSDELKSYGERYYERVKCLAPTATTTVDKNLVNFLRVGLIDVAFNDALTINCLRNPLDTCLSCYFQALDPAIFAFSFDLENLGKFYGGHQSLMDHWRTVLTNPMLEINYEDVIADTAKQIARISEHLPASTDEEAAEMKESAIVTSSAWQARQPVYESSINRWKNYEAHLGPLLAALDDAGVDYEGVG